MNSCRRSVRYIPALDEIIWRFIFTRSNRANAVNTTRTISFLIVFSMVGSHVFLTRKALTSWSAYWPAFLGWFFVIIFGARIWIYSLIEIRFYRKLSAIVCHRQGRAFWAASAAVWRPDFGGVTTTFPCFDHFPEIRDYLAVVMSHISNYSNSSCFKFLSSLFIWTCVISCTRRKFNETFFWVHHDKSVKSQYLASQLAANQIREGIYWVMLYYFFMITQTTTRHIPPFVINIHHHHHHQRSSFIVPHL